jgi:hypothetical protein
MVDVSAKAMASYFIDDRQIGLHLLGVIDPLEVSAVRHKGLERVPSLQTYRK